jgi:alpha-glucosidase (family GH31 glycosyl hydrolase)
MNQNNPFAKLGALDQMLYHDTALTLKDVPSVIDEQPRQHSENTLLANQQTSKETKQQVSKLAKKQNSKETNQQTSTLANQQVSKETNQQTTRIALSTKEKKKYGTYLREDSILNIQVHAIQTKRKDHEVLQEAVDFYFADKK